MEGIKAHDFVGRDQCSASHLTSSPADSSTRSLHKEALWIRSIPRMMYNLHQIAHSGPLPAGFSHSLVSISHSSEGRTQVYAIGTKEQGLQVYQLDDKLLEWNVVSYSYQDEITRRLVDGTRRGHVVAGVGSFIFVVGGRDNQDDVILKFDTTERKWCTERSFANISSRTVAAVALGEKIVVLCGSVDKEPTSEVYILDTVNCHWTLPRVVGVPVPVKDVRSAVAFGQEAVVVQGSSENDIWMLKVRKPFEEVVWKRAGFNTPVVICGPSGVGKGTLINKLMKEFPERFGFSVSHTTRKPREKEVDGIHYHFTNRASMEAAVSNGEFLEHANVHGNLYGTSVAAVEAVSQAGKRCILDIDVQGAKSVRSSSMQALFIFIAPPSFEELERRLRGRGTETNEQITRRLNTALTELELAKDHGLFDHVLVNDDLETTYQQLKEILGLYPECSTSIKQVITVENKLLSRKDVFVLEKSKQRKGMSLLPIEPNDFVLSREYTNMLQLSELECLTTGTNGAAAVLSLRK